MENWALPEGWGWSPLIQLVAPTERREPSRSPDSPFTYIDISSIDNERGIIRDPKALFGREAPSRARKVVRKDDVIFATTRPYLRNIALVPEIYDNQICSTGFCVLQAKPERLLPRYLFYVCRSSVVIDQLTPRMRGASYPAVTDPDIFSVEIPLPSVETQRRIVTRLEELSAQLAEAQVFLTSVSENLGILEQTILAQAFRGEL